MTAGPNPSRWISLCAAALVLVQLGGMAHLAVTPHGVCWEHGVVVEQDILPPTALAPAPPAAPGVDPAPGPPVRSDAHPHCAALWLRRSARPGFQSSWPLRLARDEVAAPGAQASVALSGLWALRNAPKHSPPV